MVTSGEHRRDQWEAGWRENLDLFLRQPNDVGLIIPNYFNKYGAIRWRGRYIRPLSEQFEYRSLAIIQDWLFDQYLRDAAAIYEFGCGTGINLLRARQVNPGASLWGLDWVTSSQQIIEQLAGSGIDSNIRGHRFDYFDPDGSFRLASDSFVYTVASLEQVGARWDKFVDYILHNRPRLCVHIEPIAELLNPDKFIDYLSIEYFKKRNYLKGFLSGLRRLEQEGKVRILRAQRTYIGSLFIEGYSVVVWAPTGR
jgi:SAM-dependent methyltransferase